MKNVIQVGNSGMGRGDEELGSKLMLAHLTVLTDPDRIPEAVVFFNSGVKIVCEGSVALAPLRELEQQGVKLMACGTCIDSFNLREKVEVGTISNMPTITDTMLAADKVISL